MASRDLPHSLNDLAFGWIKHLKEEIIINKNSQQLVDEDFQPDEDVTKETKVKLNNLWPAFASGAGLFADGYVNNSIGIVMACLKFFMVMNSQNQMPLVILDQLDLLVLLLDN